MPAAAAAAGGARGTAAATLATGTARGDSIATAPTGSTGTEDETAPATVAAVSAGSTRASLSARAVTTRACAVAAAAQRPGARRERVPAIARRTGVPTGLAASATVCAVTA
jgi:hypothetical protein